MRSRQASSVGYLLIELFNCVFCGFHFSLPNSISNRSIAQNVLYVKGYLPNNNEAKTVRQIFTNLYIYYPHGGYPDLCKKLQAIGKASLEINKGKGVMNMGKDRITLFHFKIWWLIDFTLERIIGLLVLYISATTLVPHITNALTMKYDKTVDNKQVKQTPIKPLTRWQHFLAIFKHPTNKLINKKSPESNKE